MTQKITPRQMQAITALATGQDISKAAEIAGVARETVSRWLRLPQVQAELATIETQATVEATRRLATLLNRTVDELEKLLISSTTTPADRLRTIRTILEAYPRMADLTRIDARLEEIERMLADDK